MNLDPIINSLKDPQGNVNWGELAAIGGGCLFLATAAHAYFVRGLTPNYADFGGGLGLIVAAHTAARQFRIGRPDGGDK